MFSKRKKIVGAIVPVFHSLVPYLDSFDNTHLISTCKMFKLLYTNEIWLNLYKCHFGKLYFAVDYREQCIAAFLLKTAETQFPWGYDKLYKHIQPHCTKKWTFYYSAHFDKENYHTERTQIDYGLDALQSGDQRARPLLLDLFKQELFQRRQSIQLEILVAVEGILKQQLVSSELTSSENTKIKQQLCILYCLCMKNSKNIQDKNFFENLVLTTFIQSLNPNDSKVVDFVLFFYDMLKMLGLIHVSVSIFNNEMKLANVLEVVSAFLSQNYQFADPLRSLLTDWKQLNSKDEISNVSMQDPTIWVSNSVTMTF